MKNIAQKNYSGKYKNKILLQYFIFQIIHDEIKIEN